MALVSVGGNAKQQYQHLVAELGRPRADALVAQARAGTLPHDDALIGLGVSRRSLETIAEAQLDILWARSEDPGVQSMRDAMQGAVPQHAGGTGSTVGRTTHGLKTPAERAAELKLNTEIALPGDFGARVDAGHPISAYFADQFGDTPREAHQQRAMWEMGIHRNVEAFIGHLATMAVETPDLAAAVLARGPIREELAKCLRAPLPATFLGAIAGLAMHTERFLASPESFRLDDKGEPRAKFVAP